MKQRRRKGDGTLFKNKKSKYYYIQYYMDGKLKQKSLRVTNKEEAEIKAKEFMALHNDLESKGDFIEAVAKSKGLKSEQIDSIKKVLDRHTGKDIKMAEAFRMFLAEPDRPTPSNEVIRQYKHHWELFVSFIGEEVYLHEIMANDVKEFGKHLLRLDEKKIRVHSDSNYNRIINKCRCIIKTLMDTANLNSNPFQNMGSRTVERTSRRNFTKEEVDRLLEATEGELRLLFAIAVYTGMRLKDAVLCKWENIDFTTNSIHIKPAKTAKYNQYVNMPIISQLKRELKLFGYSDESEYILPSLSSRYLSHRSNLKKDFKKAFKDAKISSDELGLVGFHSLRHTFVSDCAKAGVPLAIVQEVVGHSNTAMTRHYTNIDAEMTQQQIMKLSDEGKAMSLEEVKKLVSQMNSENWETIKNQILKA
ncbi:tyrosine-type recombinase/integrase [Lentisphaera profundi]|uniref:Tyrosine-type recombinase/integrase n=1 Tax=Lentisphaera profundi TaxID=1658616 RepID=A0ABY7VYA9_9BACT|nr:tyrosine-type recombinase/integrase [Lentisphaera profundi]WDE97857.1 tyrosine-type recombinase/integrase [Lentisphaera profundi]